MANVSLYRKWRPRNLEEVIGQKHVTETLSNALSGGRLVHAYLFAGPRGTGKTSTARILAKAINCEQGPTATPCNKCEACISISDGTALDVEEIDAASNRKIDEIRELLDKIPYLPTSMRSKVYIIDEVHQLTAEASSALLKTLEEPPGHIFFVLATTEPHKLLPTIVSRCQRFDFSLVDTNVISDLLQRIASSENIDISENAIAMIAEQAHGSVRDAIGAIDQISNLSGERIAVEHVAELLGDVEPELVFGMIDIIAERDATGALGMVGRMMESGKDPRRFVEALISQLRNLFLIQNAAEADEIVRVTADHYNRLKDQAERIRGSDILRLIERMGDVHREMRWSENPRLELECALVKVLRLETDISVEGLLYRVEELEKRTRRFSEAPPLEKGPRGKAGVPEPSKPDDSKTGDVSRAHGEKRGRAGGKPAKEAVVTEAAAVQSGSGDVKPAAVPAGGKGEEAGLDNSKVRRAWMALLSDFKNRGEMRLYALLTKAKVKEHKGGVLYLAFPKEASFQAAALEKGEDLELIQKAWSSLVGEPVEVKIAEDFTDGRTGGGRTAAGPEPGRSKTEKPNTESRALAEGEPVVPAKPEKTNAAVKAEESPHEVPDAEKANGEERKTEGDNTRDIAKLLQESFNGEIIDENDEGKDQ